MAKKKRTVAAYYVKTKGVEIGPFRSRSAAVEEAKAIEASGDKSVKIREDKVSPDTFDFGAGSKGKGKKQSKDDDPDSRFFETDDDDEEEDDDDDDEDDEEEDDEDGDEDDDDEDDEEDEEPEPTHFFFRKIGKG